MKRTCRITLTILLASLLLAAPALAADGAAGSERKATGDSSAQPASPSTFERTGEGSVQPGYSGKDSSSMSEKTTARDSLGRASKNSRIAASSLKREQIREMQRLLSAQGYSPGNADGMIGPRTQAAIRQFQTANELTVNGTADQQTLRALAPNADKQQFFGVPPAYGEAEGVKGQQPMKKDTGEKLEQPVNKEPREGLQQPMNKDPGNRVDQPNKEPGKINEQPMKKTY